MSQGGRYVIWSMLVVFLFVIGVGVASLLFTNSQVRQVRTQAEQIAAADARLRQQLTADCQSNFTLAGLPLVNTMSGRPSELGVRIISNARASWMAHGCPGKLPPPDPTFVAGAKLYGVPVN